MAKLDPSRSALIGGTSIGSIPMTLADVRDRLADTQGLSSQQRTDLRSGLNVIARALGRPLETIPASPNMLRDALDKVSHSSVGLSRQSWANTRSRLNKALQLTGVPVMRGKRVVMLSPEWQAYYDRLPNRRFRASLSRFMTFCSARGTRPEDVCPETFERFLSSLELQSLRRRPQDGYRDTVKAWNRARREIVGWPDIAVPVPDRRDWYVHDWDTYPANLKTDIDSMVADCTGADLVTMKAPRRIQMDSALARVGHLKRLMSGYVHRGGDPGRLRSLADVIGHDIVTEGLRFHLERAGGEPNTHHAQIVIAVLAVARQWVGVSEDHLTGLKRLQKTFRLPRPGMAEETRKLLRRYDDPVLLGLLLNRPAEVIRYVTAKAHIAPADAARAAAALGVVMLLECPVRPKNMASVDFDKNIMRTEHKRQPSVTLSFGADEIKNDVDLLMPLSSEAVALLDLYLQHIRPVLVQTDCSYLFPARDGGHLAPAYFSDRIARFMLAEVGVRMTAHKFRHLAGYLFLKQNPGQHEVVRCLLGHKDIATTVTYYAPIEQDEAFRHYDDLIGGLRKASLAKPKRRKR